MSTATTTRAPDFEGSPTHPQSAEVHEWAAAVERAAATAAERQDPYWVTQGQQLGKRHALPPEDALWRTSATHLGVRLQPEDAHAWLAATAEIEVSWSRVQALTLLADAFKGGHDAAAVARNVAVYGLLRPYESAWAAREAGYQQVAMKVASKHLSRPDAKAARDRIAEQFDLAVQGWPRPKDVLVGVGLSKNLMTGIRNEGGDVTTWPMIPQEQMQEQFGLAAQLYVRGAQLREVWKTLVCTARDDAIRELLTTTTKLDDGTVQKPWPNADAARLCHMPSARIAQIRTRRR